MKIIFRTASLCIIAVLPYLPTPAYAADITGAGATSPSLIYLKWGTDYQSQGGAGLNYQAISSGDGMRQILTRIVDFAAVDIPLKAADLQADGLMQFPVLIEAAVPVVNLQGVVAGQLRLDGKVLSDIFLGKIGKWNDSRIAATNPGIALPDAAINVVYRVDAPGSGSLFGNYLAQFRPEQNGTNDVWPVGTGGMGDSGVSAYVQRIPNSIGYVGYVHAMQNKLTYALVRNRDGQFVKPEPASFKAAVSNAHWDVGADLDATLVNAPGSASWPITGATYILIYKVQDNPASGRDVLTFFDWVFSHGDPAASNLGYLPLPEAQKNQVRAAWKAQITDAAGKPLWH